MQKQSESVQQSCAIMGMGLCTPRWPDLRMFKRYLLNGRATENPGGKSQPLDVEELLSCVLARALSDAGLDQSSQKGNSLPLVIHYPDSSDQANSADSLLKDCPAVIDVEKSVLVCGDFAEALEGALSLLQNSTGERAGLCSFIEGGAGLGCVLLARQANASGTYTRLASGQNGAGANARSATIINLLHAALSLNDRTHFPAVSNHTSPSSNDEKGENSRNLMRPRFSRPFAEKYEKILALDGNSTSLKLEKEYSARAHSNQPFRDFGLHLLPVNFAGLQSVSQTLDEIIRELSACKDLAAFLRGSYIAWGAGSSAGGTLVVLGSSREDLLAELERARSGLPAALESGRDWQTPNGSVFTPRPLGPQAKIAFVYPGAFGTYVGMGREIFYLFPQLHEALLEVSDDPGKTINESVIFPQTLTPTLKEQLQEELNGNPTEMISSGVCFSHLFTVMLRDIFKVEPQSAFGYSLGENSMMFALGLWSRADAVRTSLEAAPIFHRRVSGPQNAIREFWGLPSVDKVEKDEPPIWANFVLMTPLEKVQNAIENEERVYITHINTLRQVVIGGDPNACRRVIEALKCMHLQTPYRHAIHCPPVESEYEAFVRLHEWPLENKPDIPIYTAAHYAPLPYDAKAIAQSFARMLTHPIDFPRLVELAYQDGARIFIELGAGSNCSKWVDACLKDRPHAAMSINQNNLDDHTAILRLLARLIGQQVPLDLSCLIKEYV